MEKTWATSADPAASGRGGTASGADLHLDLSGPGGVRAALVRALRDAVRSGRLTPGTRLPSSRSLAGDLGMARNTVADAYGELVAEGWLTARQGSGTRVAQAPAVRPAAPARSGSPVRSASAGGLVRPPARPLHDLRTGTADISSFPRTVWAAAARRALTAAPNEAFGYGDVRGRVELRTALAEYLARARGVRAEPERIVVCGGFMQGLALLGGVLRRRGTRAAAVESYGFWEHHDVFTRAGLRQVPIPVDDRGADVTGLDGRRDVGAVLLTPAHQFPTGVHLHPDRRTAVVEWAGRTGGLVVEDDYDGEFRYDGRQVGALQGLAPDRVVYCGTTSKSLSPALRLSWMVLPEDVAAEVVRAKSTGEWRTGTLEQLTLAEFITSGAYDRHVRSMRLRYRRRRDRLVAALAEHAPHIRVTGIAAGLHVVLELPPGTEQSTLQAAHWQGLALEGLSRYRHAAAPPLPPEGPDGVIVAYGTPADHTFPGVLEALLRSLPPAD
ncbi:MULTISPECIES: MocR-like pyridoxine biosynthesis transcription factor PdxR [Streptomyces]|uniref:MocR-like pyridoxine biosynthesis transcription factor PdxR n=1 Tax=Streptomyces TaxID=1883 RepID=UPI00163BD201|nr:MULTISPECIES: PLP-dependent aminotransferase family protein [Streptomyces]MBC2874743.1 PLP-dependent aminotransferase family protein [Streptomyces sp. TYQ1024]UBI37197.1 PLP-dependent aminotransferase family protein [Streptomyces mobaraensis]UKW29790.1 PLP-dependent aminotransferase family protein [Streptomyces sp. TYQ1024]